MKKGGIYIDDRQVYGQGAHGNDLDSLLSIRQESDSTISLCGPVGRDTYYPDKGKWTYVDYDFLIKGESIEKLLPISSSDGSRVAETSRNRLLLVNENWTAASRIDAGFTEAQFDGRTFWRIANGRLEAHTLKREKKEISLVQGTYFSGGAPELSSAVEAWISDSKLYFVTRNSLAKYDTQAHTWTHRPLPIQRAIAVQRQGDHLLVADSRGFRKLSLPSLKGPVVKFPAGRAVKVDFQHRPIVATLRAAFTEERFLSGRTMNGRSWSATDPVIRATSTTLAPFFKLLRIKLFGYLNLRGEWGATPTGVGPILACPAVLNSVLFGKGQAIICM